jgi:hypothetical protein
MPTNEQLIQGNAIAENQLNTVNRKDAAMRASELAKTGDLEGALRIMGEADPEFMKDALPKIAAINPEITKNLSYGKTYGDEKAKLDLGVDPVTVGKATGKGDAVFQVRDPLTGEVKLVRRSTGDLVGSIGTPSAPQQPGAQPAQGQQPPAQEDPVAKGKRIYQGLNPKERTYYDKSFEDLMKDSADDRTAVLAGSKIISQLDGGKELDGDIMRAVQTQFARLSGEKGAMSEPDVREWTGLQSVDAVVKRMATMKLTGKMPESDRKFLRGVAGLMQKAAQNAVVTRAQPFTSKLAQTTSMTIDDANALLLAGMGGYTAQQQKAGSATKASSGRTIASTQYSPSRNQTLITYSDGTTELKNGR